MHTTVPVKELQTLGDHLQDLLDGIPLGIRCSFRQEQLIVIGQHRADFQLEPKQAFKLLERTIQSLQLHFIQQVRLYLQVMGEKNPYASREFRVQPLPPPPNPAFCTTVEVKPKDEEWVVPDEELDELLRELVAPESDRLDSSYHELEFMPLEPHEQQGRSGNLALLSPPGVRHVTIDLPLPEETRTGGLNGRVVLTTGIAALGLVGGVYTLTRPCIWGSCPELQAAQTLSQRSVETVQRANTRRELELAQRDMGQAIATLETIPLWSGRSEDAQSLVQDYESQARMLTAIIAVDDAATAAIEKQQNIYNMDDWTEITSLWQTTVSQLEKIPPASVFYRVAQEKLRDYRATLAMAENQLQRERDAQHVLDIAREGIQLVETRRQMAQSIVNWQIIRANWEVVVARLQEIPVDTVAGKEAQRLLTAYQPEVVRTQDRIEQERATSKIFDQATQQMQRAQMAEQRADWQGAVVTWTQVIRYTQQIPSTSIYRNQAEALVNSSKTAIAKAEQNIQLTAQVSSQLANICKKDGLRTCGLLSAGDVIRIQLDPGYIQMIEAVRNSGNRSLQGVVYQHQLTLKRSLEGIANRFRRPVEVYDSINIMLDRHKPQE